MTKILPFPVKRPPQKVNGVITCYFGIHDVRVIPDEETLEPWFVAEDIAKALGHRFWRQAVRAYCNSTKLFSEKDSAYPNPDLHGIMLIEESEVFQLVSRSKQSAAERFFKWLMQEAMPFIQKHGIYDITAWRTKQKKDPNWLARHYERIYRDQATTDAPAQQTPKTSKPARSLWPSTGED